MQDDWRYERERQRKRKPDLRSIINVSQPTLRSRLSGRVWSRKLSWIYTRHTHWLLRFLRFLKAVSNFWINLQIKNYLTVKEKSKSESYPRALVTLLMVISAMTAPRQSMNSGLQKGRVEGSLIPILHHHFHLQRNTMCYRTMPLLLIWL